MLRKRIVPTFEKITIEGIDTVSVFLLGNPKYPLLPFLIKNISGVGRNKTEKSFIYKLSSTRIPKENSFAILNMLFRYLHCIMDVKLILFIK